MSAWHDIQPVQPRTASRPQKTVSRRAAPAIPTRPAPVPIVQPSARPAVRIRVKITIPGKLVAFMRIIRSRHMRVAFGVMALLLIGLEIVPIMQPSLGKHTYAIDSAESLLPAASDSLAQKLIHNTKYASFTFNDAYTPALTGIVSKATASIKATANEDATKGVTVTDAVNNIDFTMTPKFPVAAGKQRANRIIYPLQDRTGWLVYTMQSSEVKEDILLDHANGDAMKLTYALGTGSDYKAKLLPDGSVGIYGYDLPINGDVSVGSDQDAAALSALKAKTDKSKLFFTLPAPIVNGKDKTRPPVSVKYALNAAGNELTVTATGLKKASYPLTIDPSIYVETAQKFMRGNNETNVDFDVDDTLIQKGKTTGARFDEWKPTTSLPESAWNGGTAAAGGYLYTVGGTSFNGQIFSTTGSDTYTVPDGVSTVTVKAWGGGGGGGAGNSTTAGGTGGDGGGGGFAQADIAVTAGESLTVNVGSGGAAGPNNSNAGDGGGFSAVQRGSTYLVQAGGGGGGGGGRSSGSGGVGGGGSGGNTPEDGQNGTGAGGGGGSASAGGSGGNNGTGGSDGSSGAANLGGDGGGSGNNCNSNVNNQRGHAGGTGGGGDGGNAGSCEGGGGGGGGRFGGGGGGSASASGTRHGGGGGGGSGLVTGTNTTQSAAPGDTPANASDAYRNGAAQGGVGGDIPANSTDGSSGLVAIIVTGSDATTSNTLTWEKFNTTTGELSSPDPGTGPCSGWCTKAAYNLPQPRAGFSLIAYSGFLYVIGGVNASGTRQNSVYIAKLGANGEPQLWHPTDTNKANWVFWYQDTNLSSVRAYSAAVAYNNHMYLMGGVESSTPTNKVEVADINPTGVLNNWRTTGMQTMPTARYGHSAQAYNDRLYLIGGASSIGGTPLNTVYYTKINADGSLAGWVQTSSFTTGRMTWGGTFSTIWGAYIYLSGGCSAVNGSGNCTTVEPGTQLASINADGSLDIWNDMANVTNQRIGYALVAWRNRIYTIGGCSAMNTTSGACTSTIGDISYGDINQDGDASTVNVSSPSGTAPCSGTDPTNCNLPPVGNSDGQGGQMLSATIIMNGYLYVIGGCRNNLCSSVSRNTSYAAIASDGSLSKPTTCSDVYYGAWCVDSTHTINGTTGIAAAGVAIFNGQMYVVGGLTGGGNAGEIYHISTNPDGSLDTGGWSTQTMSGVGISQSVSYLYAYARANPANAATSPGNLYIFGGCGSSTDAGCNNNDYRTEVYKCNIQTSGAVAACSTSGQLQIDADPNTGGNQGLGTHAGTVYANYIYLIGGLTSTITDMNTTRYAKFDNNNNVVAASGTSWVESPHTTSVGRRRGAAFGYNGYIYVVGGYDGTSGGGVLADIEFAKIDVSNGGIGTFSKSAVTINQRWGLSVPVSNSYAYVLGGCNAGASPSSCTSLQPSVQTFQIYNNDSGVPAGYQAGTNIGVNRIGGSTVIMNGYIYYAGGCTAIDCSAVTSATYYAPIGDDGVIGTWASGASLSAARGWGKLVTAGGSLYYVGGQNASGTPSAGVYYCNTFSSGDPSGWTAVSLSHQLPVALTEIGAAVWNNRIYVTGGYDGTDQRSDIYVSPDLSSGGNIAAAWTTNIAAFNVARSGHTSITYANNLYVLGGYDGTHYLSDVQFAKINSDGSVGSFTYTTSLPASIRDADGFAANGYMYLIGGRTDDTSCVAKTLVAPMSANTAIASGNNPTGTGEWFETNQRYTGDRYGAAAAYADGKAYVLGGGCTAFVGASDRTYYTTLLSQPQVAKYSIMFDTDSDVFPSKWLLNGVDNSIGASWQLAYRSMTNTTTSCTTTPMTTWGATTNFGNVVLGTPGTYTPKDASGTNTGCARFFYIAVSVDSSQAYGYPDDVTRGPTITDLTLEFTADPAKRLMHGRTFTGGLQQPDDTPF